MHPVTVLSLLSPKTYENDVRWTRCRCDSYMYFKFPFCCSANNSNTKNKSQCFLLDFDWPRLPLRGNVIPGGISTQPTFLSVASSWPLGGPHTQSFALRNANFSSLPQIPVWRLRKHCKTLCEWIPYDLNQNWNMLLRVDMEKLNGARLEGCGD